MQQITFKYLKLTHIISTALLDC